MTDMIGFPRNASANQQIFNANSTAAGQSWYVWNKPIGCSFIHVLCVGGGGGGGGGFVGANNAAGGGGGGGSSGHSSVHIPAWLIPDTMFVSVGYGGAGGAAAAGSNGVLSYVSMQSNTIANHVLAVSGAAAAVGGGRGTAAAGGSTGTAGTVPAITAMCLAMAGNYTVIAGQVGIIGRFGATGTGVVAFPTTGVRTMGGAGGASVGNVGTTYAGGNMTAVGVWPTGVGGAASTGTGVVGDDGSHGYMLNSGVFFSTGGCGGGGGYGTGATVGGGKGGNGGPGSGGGGGGGALTGTTNGSGGNGGNGIVIITSY